MKVFQLLANTIRKTPLSARSILVVLFCGYLLIGPIPNSSDIIAASLACGLLTTLAAIFLITTFQYLYTKNLCNKKASQAIHFNPPAGRLTSGESATCVLSMQADLKLFPGLAFQMKPVCKHSGIVLPTIRITKGKVANDPIPFEITAPHRGNWEIGSIKCSIGDLTGFITYNWEVRVESSITVAPAAHPETLLPLISSTQRAGDTLNDTVHRLGDPFDIKPYHPSDGVKKIIWKAFAKSGELLSRHPEASMTPEGFVAIFVLAKPEDDLICAKALSYVESLKELNLDLALCCEGQKNRPVGHNYESSCELLIDSCWDSAASDMNSIQADLQLLFDTCSSYGVAADLRKIAVFCEGSRLAQRDDSKVVEAVISWFDRNQIEPVFFLTDPNISQIPTNSAWSNRIYSMFVEPETSRTNISRHLYENFLSTCLNKQWEVFV